MSALKELKYVDGYEREGIDILYVGEKRVRHTGYPFPPGEIIIEPYCGISHDFCGLFQVMLAVGAFGYDSETEKLIKNVYGYVGVQVFYREPGFFNEHPETNDDWTECVNAIGKRDFMARDDGRGYRLVEAYRALRILDALNGFGQAILANSLLLSGIGGADSFKEGIGDCLSGLTVFQLKEILESFPPDLMRVYGYILEEYMAYPSVSEMDMVIACGHEEVKKLRQSVSIALLDEEVNKERNKISRHLSEMASNLRGGARRKK